MRHRLLIQSVRCSGPGFCPGATRRVFTPVLMICELWCLTVRPSRSGQVFGKISFGWQKVCICVPHNSAWFLSFRISFFSYFLYSQLTPLRWHRFHAFLKKKQYIWSIWSSLTVGVAVEFLTPFGWCRYHVDQVTCSTESLCRKSISSISKSYSDISTLQIRRMYSHGSKERTGKFSTLPVLLLASRGNMVTFWADSWDDLRQRDQPAVVLSLNLPIPASSRGQIFASDKTAGFSFDISCRSRYSSTFTHAFHFSVSRNCCPFPGGGFCLFWAVTFNRPAWRCGDLPVNVITF